MRVKRGILAAWMMSSLIIIAGSAGLYAGSGFMVALFTSDTQVIETGSRMLRIFALGYISMPVIQILNGALRGAGLSKIPMFFMLGSFVVLRQIYLMVTVPLTHSLWLVMAGWPITWGNLRYWNVPLLSKSGLASQGGVRPGRLAGTKLWIVHKGS